MCSGWGEGGGVGGGMDLGPFIQTNAKMRTVSPPSLSPQ